MVINMEFIENDNKFDMEFEGTQTINGGSVTAEGIKSALGYTPADQTDVDALKEAIKELEGSGSEITAENIAAALGYVPVNPENMPTKTSQLTNDSGFIKDIPSEYVTETELNAKGYLTQHQDLSNYAKKEDIPTVPTKTSQLTNDSGFLTEHQQLPTHLPNPQKLTFTGAVTGEYDGSNALSVEIPSGGSGGNSGEWKLINTITISESVNLIDILTDNEGKPFEVTDLLIYSPLGVKASANTQLLIRAIPPNAEINSNTNDYDWLTISTSMNSCLTTQNKSLLIESDLKGGRITKINHSTYDINNTANSGNNSCIRFQKDSVEKIGGIRLSLQNVTTFDSGTFYIWGR